MGVGWRGEGGLQSSIFLPCKECGREAYRSINIESSRKYNLPAHCSPSGVRRLAGARRIKYIHKQTPRYACTRTRTHTSLLKCPRIISFFFQSWRGTPGVLAALHGLWHSDLSFTSHLQEGMINGHRKQCKELKISIL